MDEIVEIEIEERSPKRAWQDPTFEISAVVNERRYAVSVNGGSEYGSTHHAQVNWSAYGSVTAAEAREYARLLIAAADQADALGEFVKDAD